MMQSEGWQIKKPIFIRIAFVVTIMLLLIAYLITHKNAQEFQNGAENLSDVRYFVAIRLDKQNDVYHQLGQMFGSFAISNDRDILAAQIFGFCEGANCFAQNDIIDGVYDLLYRDKQSLFDTLRALTSATAKIQIDTLVPLGAIWF